jgi:RNase P subunit RPR2
MRHQDYNPDGAGARAREPSRCRGVTATKKKDIMAKIALGECAHCQSSGTTTRSAIRATNGQIWVSATCTECGDTWTERYTMIAASFISDLA